MRNLRIKPFFARNKWRRVLILSLCFALLAGTTLNASAFNAFKVRNKSFEKDSNKDGIPNAWEPTDLSAKSKRVCNKAKHKNCSFKMVADGTENWLRQVTKNSAGPFGIKATVSVWMKGKDLVGGASWVYVRFNQTDGGTQFMATPVIGDTFGWTNVEVELGASEPFDSITIFLMTNHDSGKVWFDKVKLTTFCQIC